MTSGLCLPLKALPETEKMVFRNFDEGSVEFLGD